MSERIVPAAEDFEFIARRIKELEKEEGIKTNTSSDVIPPSEQESDYCCGLSAGLLY